MENSKWVINLKCNNQKYQRQLKEHSSYEEALEEYNAHKGTANYSALIEYRPFIIMEDSFTNEEIIDNFENHKACYEALYGVPVTITKEEYAKNVNRIVK